MWDFINHHRIPLLAETDILVVGAGSAGCIAAIAAAGSGRYRVMLAERYGLSIYDAMIAAAAVHAGCDTLWSEDMQHGMLLGDGLRVVDPFRVSG